MSNCYDAQSPSTGQRLWPVLLFSSPALRSGLTEHFNRYTMAVVYIMAKVQEMPSRIRGREHPRDEEFQVLLIDLFRRAGWSIHSRPSAGSQADLVIESAGKKYVVEIKRSSEGRRDRLVPLLSQAILQAQAAARLYSKSAIPVAVVASPHISDLVAAQVKEFALTHAPEVGIGVIDSEGLRVFHGFGLERLNSERSSRSRVHLPVERPPSTYLFSDLNQWMLKSLIGQDIQESLLTIPRGQYRNGRMLAQAAGVSPMSASRFVRELLSEGFLDQRHGSLRLVRKEELLRRWQGASQRAVHDVPVRWIIRGGEEQLLSAVRSYCSRMDANRLRRQKPRAGRMAEPAPRIAIGLFGAADLLGVGFVHGAVPYLYLEHLSVPALEQLGLSVEDAKGQPDAFVRVPENIEAVFRAAVQHQGVPVSDILQVWLDVSNHPARGKEQADQIWKRILAPLIQQVPR